MNVYTLPSEEQDRIEALARDTYPLLRRLSEDETRTLHVRRDAKGGYAVSGAHGRYRPARGAVEVGTYNCRVFPGDLRDDIAAAVRELA